MADNKKFDEIFAQFDSDGSGEITCSEIEDILQALTEAGYANAPVGQDCNVTAAKILQIAKKDADGKISKEEFRKYMEEAMKK